MPQTVCNLLNTQPTRLPIQWDSVRSLDPGWNDCRFSLRLVLKPSFHPEICLTFVKQDSTAENPGVCLSEMLWQQMHPRQLPTYHEKNELDESEVQRIESLCSTLAINAEQPICLDAMGLNAVWRINDDLVEFNSHVYGEAVSTFVTRIIRIAWGHFDSPGIRNGIAHCAQFVGLNYSIEPEPPKPAQLLVLGNPEDVAEYFKQVQKRRDGE